MLFLGVVQHDAQLHPLPGLFAVGERAHAGQDRVDPRVFVGQHGGACLTAFGPLPGHPFQIADQKIGGGLEVLPTAVAIAAGAVVTRCVIGPRTVTRAVVGAVQVLAPEQEFDGMVAGGDIGLDRARLMQLPFEQVRRDLGGVHLFPAEREARVGDDVQNRQLVLIRLTTIGGVDIVDQTFVQRPCVYLAFPVIDDGIAKAEHLGLLIGHAGGQPCGFRGLKRLGRGGGDQRLDGGLQGLRGGQTVFVSGLRDVGIGVQHLGLALGECRGGGECDQRNGRGRFEAHRMSFLENHHGPDTGRIGPSGNR